MAFELSLEVWENGMGTVSLDGDDGMNGEGISKGEREMRDE